MDRNNRHQGPGGFVTFVVGALVGAAAVLFSKKENRDMAKDKLNQFKDRASGAVHNMRKDAKELMDETEKELKKTEEQLMKEK